MEGHAQVVVWVEDAIKASMDTIKETKGIALSAQVRFAILEWLESQGESPLAIKKRGVK